MYRVALEALLGFTKVGSTLRIVPCVPASWPCYQIMYRYGTATYLIDVREPHAIRSRSAQVTLDGVIVPAATIELVDDGRTHAVLVAPAGSTS